MYVMMDVMDVYVNDACVCYVRDVMFVIVYVMMLDVMDVECHEWVHDWMCRVVECYARECSSKLNTATCGLIAASWLNCSRMA